MTSSSGNRYYAAACQTDFPAVETREGIAANVKTMCGMIEDTIAGYEPFHDVRLFVFPEFSHSPPIYKTVTELKQNLSVPIPNEHTDAYCKIAKQYGCYIQTGTFIESHPDYPDHLFNTTVLIGPTGILSIYRKANPWIPWEVHSSPHDIIDFPDDIFPVVDTELGKLGVAICYDWMFPEVLRQLRFNGAEVLIRVSAYMDPWGTAEPMDWWTLINRTRALENSCYVVAANQAASYQNYPPFSWPGGSMLVDFDGRILSQAESGGGNKIVVAPIDIGTLRYERERRQGHDMFNHTRTELYNYLDDTQFASSKNDPQSIQKLNQRIKHAKK